MWQRREKGTAKCRGQEKQLQTNGICERFYKTILNEFYQVAFRKKIYNRLED